MPEQGPDAIQRFKFEFDEAGLARIENALTTSFDKLTKNIGQSFESLSGQIVKSMTAALEVIDRRVDQTSQRTKKATQDAAPSRGAGGGGGQVPEVDFRVAGLQAEKLKASLIGAADALKPFKQAAKEVDAVIGQLATKGKGIEIKADPTTVNAAKQAINDIIAKLQEQRAKTLENIKLQAEVQRAPKVAERETLLAIPKDQRTIEQTGRIQELNREINRLDKSQAQLTSRSNRLEIATGTLTTALTELRTATSRAGTGAAGLTPISPTVNADLAKTIEGFFKLIAGATNLGARFDALKRFSAEWGQTFKGVTTLIDQALNAVSNNTIGATAKIKELNAASAAIGGARGGIAGIIPNLQQQAINLRAQRQAIAAQIRERGDTTATTEEAEALGLLKQQIDGLLTVIAKLRVEDRQLAQAAKLVTDETKKLTDAERERAARPARISAAEAAGTRADTRVGVATGLEQEAQRQVQITTAGTQARLQAEEALRKAVAARTAAEAAATEQAKRLAVAQNQASTPEQITNAEKLAAGLSQIARANEEAARTAVRRAQATIDADEAAARFAARQPARERAAQAGQDIARQGQQRAQDLIQEANAAVAASRRVGASTEERARAQQFLNEALRAGREASQAVIDADARLAAVQSTTNTQEDINRAKELAVQQNAVARAALAAARAQREALENITNRTAAIPRAETAQRVAGTRVTDAQELVNAAQAATTAAQRQSATLAEQQRALDFTTAATNALTAAQEALAAATTKTNVLRNPASTAQDIERATVAAAASKERAAVLAQEAARLQNLIATEARATEERGRATAAATAQVNTEAQLGAAQQAHAQRTAAGLQAEQDALARLARARQEAATAAQNYANLQANATGKQIAANARLQAALEKAQETEEQVAQSRIDRAERVAAADERTTRARAERDRALERQAAVQGGAPRDIREANREVIRTTNELAAAQRNQQRVSREAASSQVQDAAKIRDSARRVESATIATNRSLTETGKSGALGFRGVHDALLGVLSVSRLLPSPIADVVSSLGLFIGATRTSAGVISALIAGVLGAVAAFVQFGAELNKANAALLAQAKAIGLTFAEIKALKAISESTGQTVENFTIGLKNISQAITGLGPNALRTRTALRSILGPDFILQGRRAIDVLLDVGRAMEDPALQRSGVALASFADIAGRSYDEQAAALGNLIDEFPALTKEYEKSSAASKEAAERAEEQRKIMIRLTVAWDNFKQSLGATEAAVGILRQVQGIVDDITKKNYAGILEKAANAMGDLALKLLEALGGLIEAAANKIAEASIGIFEEIAKQIGMAFEAIGSLIVASARLVAGDYLGAWEELRTTFGKLFSETGTGLKAELDKIGKELKAAGVEVGEVAKDANAKVLTERERQEQQLKKINERMLALDREFGERSAEARIEAERRSRLAILLARKSLLDEQLNASQEAFKSSVKGELATQETLRQIREEGLLLDRPAKQGGGKLTREESEADVLALLDLQRRLQKEEFKELDRLAKEIKRFEDQITKARGQRTEEQQKEAAAFAALLDEELTVGREFIQSFQDEQREAISILQGAVTQGAASFVTLIETQKDVGEGFIKELEDQFIQSVGRIDERIEVLRSRQGDITSPDFDAQAQEEIDKLLVKRNQLTKQLQTQTLTARRDIYRAERQLLEQIGNVEQNRIDLANELLNATEARLKLLEQEDLIFGPDAKEKQIQIDRRRLELIREEIELTKKRLDLELEAIQKSVEAAQQRELENQAAQGATPEQAAQAADIKGRALLEAELASRPITELRRRLVVLGETAAEASIRLDSASSVLGRLSSGFAELADISEKPGLRLIFQGAKQFVDGLRALQGKNKPKTPAEEIEAAGQAFSGKIKTSSELMVDAATVIRNRFLEIVDRLKGVRISQAPTQGLDRPLKGEGLSDQERKLLLDELTARVQDEKRAERPFTFVPSLTGEIRNQVKEAERLVAEAKKNLAIAIQEDAESRKKFGDVHTATRSLIAQKELDDANANLARQRNALADITRAEADQLRGRAPRQFPTTAKVSGETPLIDTPGVTVFPPPLVATDPTAADARLVRIAELIGERFLKLSKDANADQKVLLKPLLTLLAKLESSSINFDPRGVGFEKNITADRFKGITGPSADPRVPGDEAGSPRFGIFQFKFGTVKPILEKLGKTFEEFRSSIEVQVEAVIEFLNQEFEKTGTAKGAFRQFGTRDKIRSLIDSLTKRTAQVVTDQTDEISDEVQQVQADSSAAGKIGAAIDSFEKTINEELPSAVAEVLDSEEEELDSFIQTISNRRKGSAQRRGDGRSQSELEETVRALRERLGLEEELFADKDLTPRSSDKASKRLQFPRELIKGLPQTDEFTDALQNFLTLTGKLLQKITNQLNEAALAESAAVAQNFNVTPGKEHEAEALIAKASEKARLFRRLLGVQDNVLREFASKGNIDTLLQSYQEILTFLKSNGLFGPLVDRIEQKIAQLKELIKPPLIAETGAGLEGLTALDLSELDETTSQILSDALKAKEEAAKRDAAVNAGVGGVDIAAIKQAAQPDTGIDREAGRKAAQAITEITAETADQAVDAVEGGITTGFDSSALTEEGSQASQTFAEAMVQAIQTLVEAIRQALNPDAEALSLVTAEATAGGRNIAVAAGEAAKTAAERASAALTAGAGGGLPIAGFGLEKLIGLAPGLKGPGSAVSIPEDLTEELLGELGLGPGGTVPKGTIPAAAKPEGTKLLDTIISKGFTAANGILQGLQADTIGGKIAGFGQIANIIPGVGQLIAGGLQIIGGIADFIGAGFRKKAERLANDIKANIEGINEQFKAGKITLGQTIGQLQAQLEAARNSGLGSGKTGKKGGKQALAEIERDTQAAIKALREQAKRIQDDFLTALETLRLPSEFRSAFTTGFDALNKIREFIGSFEDIEEALSHRDEAEEFLFLTFKDLQDSAQEAADEANERVKELQEQGIAQLRDFESQRQAIINQGRVRTEFDEAKDKLAQLFELEAKRIQEARRIQKEIDEARAEARKKQDLLQFLEDLFNKLEQRLDKFFGKLEKTDAITKDFPKTLDALLTASNESRGLIPLSDKEFFADIREQLLKGDAEGAQARLEGALTNPSLDADTRRMILEILAILKTELGDVTGIFQLSVEKNKQAADQSSASLTTLSSSSTQAASSLNSLASSASKFVEATRGFTAQAFQVGELAQAQQVQLPQQANQSLNITISGGLSVNVTGAGDAIVNNIRDQVNSRMRSSNPFSDLLPRGRPLTP